LKQYFKTLTGHSGQVFLFGGAPAKLVFYPAKYIEYPAKYVE
jgi:hypothetical protein